eukprot:jgi/Chrzof1/1753/Cz10g19210.t1
MNTILFSVLAVLLAVQSVAANLPLSTRTAFLIHQSSAGRALHEFSGHNRALLDRDDDDDDDDRRGRNPSNSGGFRTRQPSYFVPLQQGVQFYPIISAGEVAPNGYKMIGIPDGLGAYDNAIIPESKGNGRDDDKGKGRDDDRKRNNRGLLNDRDDDDRVKNKDTFTVLMNHEIPRGLGVPRAHGAPGAFVSEWVLDKRNLAVYAGADLIRRVFFWVNGGWVPQTAYAFDRFCSADLPSQSAIYNPATGRGSRDLIFFNGEETDGGRAWGHVATGAFKGNSYELVRMGRGSWENVVANPWTGDKTVVIGTSDGDDQRIVVYIGTKQNFGANPVERAGLNNGRLYSIQVQDPLWVPRNASLPLESITEPIQALQANYQALFISVEQPVPGPRTGSGFARPEDGAWDPNNKLDFYFQSTAAITNHTRLWLLRFTDDTFMSGTIIMMVQGPNTPPSAATQNDLGPKMLDNLGISKTGDMVLQEDPGNNVILARMWRSKTGTKTAALIAQHNPAVFNTSTSGQDEESSGVITIERILNRAGMWLLDVQAHSLNRTSTTFTQPFPAGPEVLEGGQLLAMYMPPSSNGRK